MKPSDKHIDLEALNYKNAGFSVPQGYFESIEPKVIAKLNSDIPVGYFDNLEDTIFAKLAKEKVSKTPVKVISLKSRFIKRFISLAAAASIALFIGINLFNKQETLTFDSLELSSISIWLEGETSIADSYVLGELLDDDDLTYLSNFDEIDDTDLLEYLNQTNIENLILNN